MSGSIARCPDGPLALGIGPASAGSRWLRRSGAAEPANDVPDARQELGVAWLGLARRECRARGRGCCGSLRPVGRGRELGGSPPRPGFAELGIVELGAGEVGVLRASALSPSPSCSCTRSSMNTGSTTQIPAAKSALGVDVRIPAVPGSVAISAVTRTSVLSTGSRGETVEFSVDALMLAAEDARDLVAGRQGEVQACSFDLLDGVEQGRRLRSGRRRCARPRRRFGARTRRYPAVPCRAGRWCWSCFANDFGELRRDLVHVGEAVCHRDRQFFAGRALRDAGADCVGERYQLAAEVVGAPGRCSPRSAQTSAIRLCSRKPPREGRPAVAELLLLV